MTHDPFDALRAANPVPDDSLPPAPMAEAERIIGARPAGFGWPAWSIAAAAAVLVLAVGGAWMLWLGDGGPTAASDPGPVAAAASTTGDTSSLAPIPVTVFLLAGTDTGSVVVPVPRAVPAPTDPDHALFTAADGALAALLAGPTADDLARDLTTAIPDGIDGPPLSIHKIVRNENGTTATVHVPFTWLDFGYPTPDGMGQIVFTLTAIDGIDGVEFALGDGRAPGGAVAGSGVLVPEDQFADHPFVDRIVTRLTYEGWMPLAFVESPAWGAEVTLPTAVSGVANSIGNRVRLTLEADEQTLWQQTITATCGTPWSECRGEWDWAVWQTTIPDVGYSGPANLTAEVFGSGVEIIDRRTTPLVVVSEGSPSVTTTTMAAQYEVPSELAVYLLMDAGATHLSPGPHLVPASRMTGILSAPLTDAPRQAMEWLLMGPLPGWEESVPALSTAIPEGTRLLGLGVSDGIATVDLSPEFVSGGGSLSMTARLAQVVFTLTRFDEIDGVRFTIDGVPTTVFGGEGVIVGDPATRDEFAGLLPAVMIETPLYSSIDSPSPLVVSGTANVFEATVSLALTDGDGLIIWEGFATATCGTGCRGEWSVEIPYEVPYEQLGSVIAWEASARDGSQTNVREHPVWLHGAPLECSGRTVPADLPDQDGLPPDIAATRARLFEAARLCDWGALDILIGDRPISVTFGEPPADPVSWLRDAEERGEQPMWWLARTLQLPASPGRASEVEPGTAAPWVWPSAFAAESWEAVPEADRQALLEVYDQEDLAGYAEFGGFIGYRVGIDADGSWLFFVAGD